MRERKKWSKEKEKTMNDREEIGMSPSTSFSLFTVQLMRRALE